MYFLYSVITAAGMILLAPYFAVKGMRTGKYWRNLRERLGKLPPEVIVRALGSDGSIWIHAVSVGEVLAVRPLAQQLKQRYPERKLFVSTTTDTGQSLARERFDFADGIFYFPLDWSPAVRRAFRAIRPALVVIVETEIWPNFLREARRRNVPVVFVNARISERSFRRSLVGRHMASVFFDRVLSDATLFLAQSDADAERLRELGAPEDRVEVTGNLKYDGDQPAIGAFGQWLADQTRTQERWPVVVAGSVVADEEEIVIAGYDVVQRQWRHALLILAPRRPDRFDAAVRIAAERGWKVVRRSTLDLASPLDENADVLILDSIGELAGLYSIADAVFVGGSLVHSGGHNILEPAWFGRPPVFGPSMENFRDMAQDFRSEGAGVQVRSGEQLGKTWMELIRDTPMRERMGQKAKDLAEKNRGATTRSIERIGAVLAAISVEASSGAANRGAK
ncbi:MAG: 3-deoxy-D-manno-octulosonic acid transferase [Candidatus Acidiferrales bacterium]